MTYEEGLDLLYRRADISEPPMANKTGHDIIKR